jgi:hypothetical protein
MIGYRVKVRLLIILLVCAALFPLMPKCAFSSAPVYLAVEPKAVSPLTNLNSSAYGLEIPVTPSAIGDNFTVELHLCNATTTNVPPGVNSIEVHFYFGNILTYAVPTGFTDCLGKTGGALNLPLLYGLDAGFFDKNKNPVTNPPYTGAVYYMAAVATTGEAWNGEDGLVAIITFQVKSQPQGNESSVNMPLDCDFTDIEYMYVDPVFNTTMPMQVPNNIVSGSLVMDSNYEPPVNYTLTVQENPLGVGMVDVEAGGLTQTSPYVFSSGTVVQVNATPNTGYNFQGWNLDNASSSSANPYSIIMNGNHTVIANFASTSLPPPSLPITLTAEPKAVAPLTNISSGPYNLEIPATQIASSEEFVVELHLRNCTQSNVPLGIGSVQVHLLFGDLLGYVQPLSFAPDKLGAADGVLNPDIQYSVSPGFYDSYGNKTNPPYDGAVSYDVAASSTGAGWNGVDGIVAVLTFEITKQPEYPLVQNGASLIMNYTYVSLKDSEGNSITNQCFNATVNLDSVSHDVEVTNTTLPKTVIGEGYQMNVDVTVANRGTVSETFLVTVYANASVIDSQTISLASGNSTTFTFTRNTTGFAKGSYTVKAVEETIPAEPNATDNTFVAVSATVTIPGDINGDGKVGLDDLVSLANALGSKVNQPNWNPNADINGDGTVDQSDLLILTQHYGKHYP